MLFFDKSYKMTNAYLHDYAESNPWSQDDNEYTQIAMSCCDQHEIAIFTIADRLQRHMVNVYEIRFTASCIVDWI